MDIYQIFTAYNNPWSHREILFFSGILIFAVIVVSYYIRKEKLNKLQAMAISCRSNFYGNCIWVYRIYEDRYNTAI